MLSSIVSEELEACKEGMYSWFQLKYEMATPLIVFYEYSSSIRLPTSNHLTDGKIWFT
jgi:hypothetical protein